MPNTISGNGRGGGMDDGKPYDDAQPIKPLTPVQSRRLKTASEIADDPSSEVTFQHTVLCQTSLPYRDPGDSIRVWERRQGAVFMAVEAGRVYDRAAQCLVEVGLPYGSRPRLILAHLNREALLQGTPRIEVENSLTAFIRRVLDHDSVNTREIGRFKNQLSRFAAAHVRMALDRPDERACQINTQIIDAFELWFDKDERQRVLWPAVVELSPRYYASLLKHAVPLDERALGALANSPMALDVYAWLAQRLHRVSPHRPQFIGWVSLHLQFGQGFKRLRKFRETFLDVLAAVHSQYRAARVEADSHGITLRHSPPPVKERIAAVPLSKPAPRPAITAQSDSPQQPARVTPPPDDLAELIANLEPASIREQVRDFAVQLFERLLQNVDGDQASCTLSDGIHKIVLQPKPGFAPTPDVKAVLRDFLDDIRRRSTPPPGAALDD